MKADEKKLLQRFRQCDARGRESLLDYAEFLASRAEKEAEPLPQPELIKAKPGETVVGAIKRLSASYPMLDRAKMLDETSTLMTEHVVQGRDKAEVINELEKLFQRHYDRLCEERENNKE